jgi:hypothetical protein
MLEEMERKRRFGEVRPLIAAVHKGHRFIVVGSRVYFHEGWRTFTDFLFFYIQDVFGKAWWVAEQAKISTEQHTVVRWQAHVLEFTKSLARDNDGFYSTVPDGIMSAFLLLAYDLYVLRDHASCKRTYFSGSVIATSFRARGTSCSSLRHSFVLDSTSRTRTSRIQRRNTQSSSPRTSRAD